MVYGCFSRFSSFFFFFFQHLLVLWFCFVFRETRNRVCSASRTKNFQKGKNTEFSINSYKRASTYTAQHGRGYRFTNIIITFKRHRCKRYGSFFLFDSTVRLSDSDVNCTMVGENSQTLQFLIFIYLIKLERSCQKLYRTIVRNLTKILYP
jgi:hypothetical protein